MNNGRRPTGIVAADYVEMYAMSNDASARNTASPTNMTVFALSVWKGQCMKTDKQKFLAQLAALAALAIQLAQQAQVVDWQYWKMGYNAGSPNQITDADASVLGSSTTAADVTAAITAAQALMTPIIAQNQIKAFFKIA